jgi:hypothetical protein
MESYKIFIQDHHSFQPTNLITGSSYEQALNKDSKFPGDKASSSAQRKGIQVHNDGNVYFTFVY